MERDERQSGRGGAETAYAARSATGTQIPGGPMRVKNKAPAPVQITAEQIVREARGLEESEYRAPAQKLADQAELDEYRLERRKHFEDLVRRVRWNQGVWVKYANWEALQKDFERARSVWERALEVDYRSATVWLKYAEMEMRARNVNHARNVWDRAVTLLPRVDQLWYKYAHMEEMLDNPAGARSVFERWMRWEPDHSGWRSFAKFELRHGEVGRAREVLRRYCEHLPGSKAWVHWAKFEAKQGERARARQVYEEAVAALGDDDGVPDRAELFERFAEFEEHCGEGERARCIYKYALERLPKSEAGAIYERYAVFEKQRGTREGIEGVVASKRRAQYEAAVEAEPSNYDAWFDWARLEEEGGAANAAAVRELYERAVANVPPAPDKRLWRRYIYLWIKYALFEELECGDAGRARAVYAAALGLIPHKRFTFSKVWVMAAHLEVREKRLGAARKLLGAAVGAAPKDKTFQAYIEMELALGQVDRCRALYEKYLEWSPGNCQAWSRFADLEASLGESERARAIYEAAAAQPVLDMPEALWKAYIDFEISEGEEARARALYERLLERTGHVKVWLSYAAFEATLGAGRGEGEGEGEGDEHQHQQQQQQQPEAGAVARARDVFKRGAASLKDAGPEAAEERVMMLEAWAAAERSWGAAGDEQSVRAKMPQRVKRKRQLTAEDGTAAGFEEYYDYVFPEEGGAPSLKILEAAYRWKRQRTGAAGGEEGGGGGGGGGGGEAQADDPPPAPEL